MCVWVVADRCGIDLPLAALDKLELNAAKYPASLAKGSSAKYHAHRSKLRQLSAVTAEEEERAGQGDDEPDAASGAQENRSAFAIACGVAAGVALIATVLAR